MSKLPYSVSFGKGISANSLEINGNLVINHIDKIYREISEKIDFSKPLNISVQNVENIDITFIQILLSLKKEFEEKKLELQISVDLSDDLWSLLKNAGIKQQYLIK
jgi:ABC-type transporter Mla MlaB component